MPTNENITTAAVKLIGSFDINCYTNWKDAVQGLVANLAVVIPASVTNVVVSPFQPSDTQRNFIWYKLNNDGSFQGIFVYGAGAWQQITPTPNGIFRMYGNSTQIPPGFVLADANNPNLTAAQATFLMANWYSDPSGLFYSIFDVTFDGF